MQLHIVFIVDQGSKFTWRRKSDLFTILRISEGTILYSAASEERTYCMPQTEFERCVLRQEIYILQKGSRISLRKLASNQTEQYGDREGIGRKSNNALA